MIGMMAEDDLEPSAIAARIKQLYHDIEETALRSGRNPHEIHLVLVSKTVPAKYIQEAMDAGHIRFGENRAQELISKKGILAKTAEWHMIGHLQTNKVNLIVGNVALIHSLDRLVLAHAIQTAAAKKNIADVDCLIQVNSSGEPSKFGLAPEKVSEFVANVSGLSRIRIRGLMTIGPLTENREKIKNIFRLTYDLKQNLRKEFPLLRWDILSMGMSGDYQLAIEAGANLLRIGSRVFGKRREVPL